MLILRRNDNALFRVNILEFFRALFRVNARAGELANDCNKEIRDMSWCVAFIDPSNDIRLTVQKGLSKKNNIDFCFYGRKTFYKNEPDANNFFFHIGVESAFEVPQYATVTFKIKNVNGQTNDGSIFSDIDATECYCKIGSINYPDDRMNTNYCNKNYNATITTIQQL